MAQKKFQSQVQRWAARAKIDSKLLVKAIAFRLYARITDLTPVDTGRARANWNIAAGDSANLSTHDGTGKASVTTQTADQYVISNNLPYIVPLEEGHSKQAPAGMVKVALATEKAILDSELGR